MLETEKHGEALLAVVKERRVDARVAVDLKRELADAISAGNDLLILDLSGVDFMDSSGLGAVVSSLKLLGRRGDLVIAGAGESVRALFKLTRMDKVFRMFDTSQAALAAIAGS